MLVSAKEMLQKAKAGKYAVGQFNINNLEWTKAILLTAEELRSPVILGVSEGAGKYMCGFNTVTEMVKAMMETLNITVPVALHLDHGTFEGSYKAMKAGFSSIMFDGSHYPIDENIEKTKQIIADANAKGISVEAVRHRSAALFSGLRTLSVMAMTLAPAVCAKRMASTVRVE